LVRKVNVSAVIDNSKFNPFFLSVLLIVIFAQLFDGYDQAIYGVALPMMMKELKLNPTEVGLLASASLWGMMIGSVIMGMLADRIGRKTILIGGIAFYSIFTGACGIVPDANSFAVVRFMAGIGLAAMTPVTSALLSEFSPRANRGVMVSSGLIGLNAGQALVTLIGIFLLPVMAWQTLYMIAFVPILLIVVVHYWAPESLAILLRRGQTDQVRKLLVKANPEFAPTNEDEYEVSVINRTKASVASLFRGGFAKTTILIWIMYFCNMYIIMGITTWMPQLMTMQGYTLAMGLTFQLVTMTGSIIGAPTGGFVADKLGFKQTLVGVYALLAIFFNLITVRMDPTVFWVVFFLGGICLGIFQPTLFAFVSQSYPISLRGTGLGWGAAMTRLAGAIAPIILGMIISANLGPAVAFGHLAIPALVGAMAILSTGRMRDFTTETAPPAPSQAYGIIRNA
jgi:MFS transporter, AAHS family, benzoate transport protein